MTDTGRFNRMILWAILFVLLWGLAVYGERRYFQDAEAKAQKEARESVLTQLNKDFESAVPAAYQKTANLAVGLATQYNKEILLGNDQEDSRKLLENVAAEKAKTENLVLISFVNHQNKVLADADPSRTGKPFTLPFPATPIRENLALILNDQTEEISVLAELKEDRLTLAFKANAAFRLKDEKKPVGAVYVAISGPVSIPQNIFKDQFNLWAFGITPLILICVFALTLLIPSGRSRSAKRDMPTESQPIRSDDTPTAVSKPIVTSGTGSKGGLARENTGWPDAFEQMSPPLKELDPAEGQVDADVLGSYKLIERIAQGGMAELYVAEHLRGDGFRRQVAIKRVLPHLTDNAEFIKRFIEEAKLAAFLQHPNIVQITDFGKLKNNYFIVMEYVHGKNLAQIMAALTSGMMVDQAVYIMSQMCRGLQYSHSKKIVHRDISPQNVLISYQGEVKISDFGIAKVGPGSGMTVGILGKLSYLSPEQAEGRIDEVDHQSDIYSLGIVFYELMTGTRLYKFKSDYEALKAIPNMVIPPLGEVRGDIPDELDRIVMRCLEKDKTRRFPDVQSLLDNLNQLKHDFSVTYDAANLSKFMEEHFGTQ